MEVTVLLIAWFLNLTIPTQEWPLLIGPYSSRIRCEQVEQVIVRLGYITGVKYVSGGCSMMSVPQQAEIFILPYVEGNDGIPR